MNGKEGSLGARPLKLHVCVSVVIKDHRLCSCYNDPNTSTARYRVTYLTVDRVPRADDLSTLVGAVVVTYSISEAQASLPSLSI